MPCDAQHDSPVAADRAAREAGARAARHDRDAGSVANRIVACTCSIVVASTTASGGPGRPSPDLSVRERVQFGRIGAQRVAELELAAGAEGALAGQVDRIHACRD